LAENAVRLPVGSGVCPVVARARYALVNF